MKKVVLGLALATTLTFANSFDYGMDLLKKGQESESVETFLMLAKSGDIDSQTMIGEMYLDGIGTKVDHEKAFYWISKAAHSGDSQAQYLLGFMYENGLNVQVNIERAVKWYEDAAKQGETLAKYNLAFIHKEGKGSIKKDMKKAIASLKSIDKSEKSSEIVTASN